MPANLATLDPQLRDIFLIEAHGYLDVLRRQVLGTANTEADRERVLAALHNLKGVSAMVGLANISRVAQKLESYFRAAAAKGDFAGVIDFSGAAVNLLSQLLANVQSGDLAANDELCDEFHVAWELAESIADRLPEHQQAAAAEAASASPAGLGEAADDLLAETALIFFTFNSNPADALVRRKFEEQWRALHDAAAAGDDPSAAVLTQLALPYLEPGALKNKKDAGFRALQILLDAIGEVNALPADAAEERQELVDRTMAMLEELPRKPAAARPLAPGSAARETTAEAAAAPPSQEEAPAPELTINVEPELLAFFIPEAQEHLDALSKALLRLEDEPDNSQAIQKLFRATHTLKGAAATVGFEQLAHEAHSMEDRVARLREQNLRPSPADLQRLFSDADRLTKLVVEASRVAGLGTPAAIVDGVIEEAGEAAADTKTLRVASEALDQILDLVGELVMARSRLNRLRWVVRDLGRDLVRDKDALRTMVNEYLAKYQYNLPAANEPLRLVASGGEALAAAEPALAGFSAAEFDRYDDLNILARKLDESAFAVRGTGAGIVHLLFDLEGETERISKIIDAVKERVMSLRMVPLKGVFFRLERALRDTARLEGKKARLSAKGGETRVDKVVAEALLDPLIQLARNAVAHGLEPPAERAAKGKPETGLVTVQAHTEGTRIIVSVQDDGRGLDPQHIREAAVRCGMLEEVVAQQVDDDKIIDAIFLPGFTTVVDAGQSAGRGVGLDVVRHAVGRLGGTVAVDYQKGWGTVFTLSMPLTLVVMPVMLVRVLGEELAVPLAAVESTQRVAAGDVRRERGRDFIEHHGRAIPLLRVRDILGHGGEAAGPAEPPYLVLGRQRQVAVQVDELVSIEDIVIKPLGPFLRELKLYAGGAILGDGRLRLILDPLLLMDLATRETGIFVPDGERQRKVPAILLVDDSISIRQVVGGFLKSAGFRVDTAADGQEAWEKMKLTRFDLILTDLEMPRLHGYELMERIQTTEEFKHIPVVVITSRSGEKHKRKAESLGAKDYLTKPAGKKELIACVKRALGMGSGD